MTAPGQPAAPSARPRPKASWQFAENDEIAPGRRALRHLGGGAVFEAYLARDEKRLSLVVCKLVRPDQVADAKALRLLRREFRLLAQLSHAAIVRSLEATLDGARPHLLLEHIDKITLRRRLRRDGALPLERVLPLALRLGAALHYLAAEGVVHLDVKPGNVMLGTPPRLIDFSLARTIENAARLRQTVGTTAYMAPEQCAPGERGAIGPAADVWGLGVTLYEAIAGQLPFPASAGKDASAPGARYPQLDCEPAPLPGSTPAALVKVILQCLRRDPAARPVAGAIVAALAPLAASLAARPPRASSG